MREIELCPGCYRLTVNQPKDWFCIPCVSATFLFLGPTVPGPDSLTPVGGKSLACGTTLLFQGPCIPTPSLHTPQYFTCHILVPGPSVPKPDSLTPVESRVWLMRLLLAYSYPRVPAPLLSPPPPPTHTHTPLYFTCHILPLPPSLYMLHVLHSYPTFLTLYTPLYFLSLPPTLLLTLYTPLYFLSLPPALLLTLHPSVLLVPAPYPPPHSTPLCTSCPCPPTLLLTLHPSLLLLLQF